MTLVLTRACWSWWNSAIIMVSNHALNEWDFVSLTAGTIKWWQQRHLFLEVFVAWLQQHSTLLQRLRVTGCQANNPILKKQTLALPLHYLLEREDVIDTGNPFRASCRLLSVGLSQAWHDTKRCPTYMPIYGGGSSMLGIIPCAPLQVPLHRQSLLLR